MEKINSIWLYKKGTEPKIFKGEEINKALKSGWVDSPAKFNSPKKTSYKTLSED